MNVLVLGAGGVGQSLAAITAHRNGDYLNKMIIADRYLSKAQEICDQIGQKSKYIPEQVDARSKEAIVAMAKKYGVGIIVTCLDTDPFNVIVMDACIEADCHYIDMGLTMTGRDSKDPTIITKMSGDDQFIKSPQFEKNKKFAVCACGVEPGLIDFFAKYAEKYFFDELDGMYTRDGGNLAHPTQKIPFGFSIFQTASECNLGPILWNKDRGFHSDKPLSHPETFWLPGGIGATRMSAIEHTEPLNMAKHIGKGLKETNFKISFGEEFENAMSYLNELGMVNQEKIDVNGISISPLEVLGAAAPNPKDIGKEMVGRTCAGLWVTGKKDGLHREIYLYQYADNQDCMKRLGCQAVVAQTAVTPAIVIELISTGKMEGPYGARVPEEFNPDPVVSLLTPYHFPAGLLEMESEYRENIERNVFLSPLL